MVNQGDVIKVEGIGYKLLVLSKNTMNESETCIVAPFVKGAKLNALHLKTSALKDPVILEQLRYLDLSERVYSRVASISIDEMFNILDAVQGLFEFY